MTLSPEQISACATDCVKTTHATLTKEVMAHTNDPREQALLMVAATLALAQTAFAQYAMWLPDDQREAFIREMADAAASDAMDTLVAALQPKTTS